jgi:hypothetical protein
MGGTKSEGNAQQKTRPTPNDVVRPKRFSGSPPYFGQGQLFHTFMALVVQLIFYQDMINKEDAAREK